MLRRSIFYVHAGAGGGVVVGVPDSGFRVRGVDSADNMGTITWVLSFFGIFLDHKLVFLECRNSLDNAVVDYSHVQK
jgi:hypothetical protein